MRTTLDIDKDVLRAAKALARRRKTTVGAVISGLARQALDTASTPSRASEPEAFHGFRPFPKRGGIVTNELINKLREGDIY